MMQVMNYLSGIFGKPVVFSITKAARSVRPGRQSFVTSLGSTKQLRIGSCQGSSKHHAQDGRTVTPLTTYGSRAKTFWGHWMGVQYERNSFSGARTESFMPSARTFHVCHAKNKKKSQPGKLNVLTSCILEYPCLHP